MSLLLEITSGWTGTLGPFTLKLNDVPFPLSGYLVELIISSTTGDIPSGGVITILDQISTPGQVSYAPIATDFVFNLGPNVRFQVFYLHWRVTDMAGKRVDFPNGQPDYINVYRE
jgi:hypothetical protein